MIKALRGLRGTLTAQHLIESELRETRLKLVPAELALDAAESTVAFYKARLARLEAQVTKADHATGEPA